jgi:hypothetical protein
MVERIRRFDLNTIEIETSLEDPKDYDYLLDSKKEIKRRSTPFPARTRLLQPLVPNPTQKVLSGADA